MAVGGLFDRQQDHAEAVVDFALDVMAGIARISEERGSGIIVDCIPHCEGLLFFFFCHDMTV